ncbi:MAG: hypothetical protein RL375_197 [Pseudomonadota bacterium]
MKSLVHALPALWRTERRGSSLPWLVVGFCTLALLVSCGGGGGVGSGGTGATASGTVTGFGSVIVDGVRFDDSKAAVSIERSADDNSKGGARAEVKLGHQLVFSFDGKDENKGVARSISIEPTLIGQVTLPAPSATSLTLLGRSVAINTDPVKGPVTVFEPNQAAITVGTQVEVHAIAGGAASSGLVATRVEVASSAGLRVSGVVSGLTTTSGVTSMSVAGVTVLLSTGAGGTTVVPSGSRLANGQVVAVFADAAGFNSATGALTAARVRVDTRKAGGVDDYVGGLITNLSGTTFNLGSITVNGSLATVSPSGTTLANGQYVRVRGSLSSNGQQLAANKISLRSAEPEAELNGNIVGFVAGSGATPSTFTIRDVVVTLPSTVTPDFTRCTGATALAESMFVEVKGTTTATGVTATAIKCEDEGSLTGATVERTGTASALGASNTATVGSFTLTTLSETIKVQYNELTYFRPKRIGSAFDGKSLIDGIKLEVEGQITGTGAAAVLVATKIKQDD